MITLSKSLQLTSSIDPSLNEAEILDCYERPLSNVQGYRFEFVQDGRHYALSSNGLIAQNFFN